MNDGSLVIQRPARATALVVFFHGVGSNAQDLAPLAQALAEQRPQAFVVSVQAPLPSDFGAGWQWFSVQGVTEANRPARVDAALPGFAETVHAWQREAGVDAGATTLVGFSQGAIMSLAATQLEAAVAGRVIAIAGRFPRPPRIAPSGTTIHLLHGEADRVMPVQSSVEAAAQLRSLGAKVTVDTFPGLGHGIDSRVLARLVELAAP
jgi:phospholipase/carboxylesterase